MTRTKILAVKAKRFSIKTKAVAADAAFLIGSVGGVLVISAALIWSASSAWTWATSQPAPTAAHFID